MEPLIITATSDSTMCWPRNPYNPDPSDTKAVSDEFIGAVNAGAAIVIADYDPMRVQLQTRYGPHMVDAKLDRLLQGMSLVMAGNNDQDFVCIHDSAHTHSQGRFRHLIHVIIEEPRVGNDRIVCQGLDTCSAGQ